MTETNTNQKPKNILIFSLTYFPKFVGGAEVAVKEITDRTSPASINFHMVTLRLDNKLPKYEKIGNVHIYRIGWSLNLQRDISDLPLVLEINKYLFPFFACRKGMRLHKKNNFNAVWSIMAGHAGFAGLFFKKKNPNIPFLLTLQEGIPTEEILRKARFVKFWFKDIFAKADVIQTISVFLADFAKKMGAKTEPVVVPNGVDSLLFSQIISDEEKLDFEKGIGKSAGDKIIITASRLVEKNAVDVIIKSLTHLPENIKLVIAGTGYEEKNLRELVRKLELSDRVRFLGFVNHQELPFFFAVSDVFVRPSRSEGFGNSFIEAMASRLPVIATPVGGIVDFLFDPDKNPDKKSTGLFCKTDDPFSLAKQIKRLFDDESLRESLVAQAQSMAKTEYDWSIISSRMRQIFSQV